jgi:hypothetical protein
LPGEIIDGRLIAAGAIKRLLHRYADAVIIDPDVVGTVANPRNSVNALSHVPLHHRALSYVGTMRSAR